MIWKKIIDIEREKKIEKNLSVISDTLIKVLNKTNSESLFMGKCGIALYFFYYSKLTNDESYKEIGYRLLDDSISAINKGFDYSTFSGGISGIAWTFNHLQKNSFIDINQEEIFGELDDYFATSMMTYIFNEGYDFLHGALGIVVYLIERKNKKIRDQLSLFIDELEKCGEKNLDFIKWLSVLNYEDKTKGYNLGLAHGMPSIMVILAYLYREGINKERAISLIGQIYRFIANQKNIKLKTSLFPPYLNEKNNCVLESRLAWCYGDLGIGQAIYQASRIIKNRNMEKEAISILKSTLNRKDLNVNRVVDATLCHGTAGIAHIYNRMYNYSGDMGFKEIALYWVDQTLKMAKFDDGFAGYKIWKTEKYGGWANEEGLLEGIAGIGLMLISTISNIEPAWDRCLLIS